MAGKIFSLCAALVLAYTCGYGLAARGEVESRASSGRDKTGMSTEANVSQGGDNRQDAPKPEEEPVRLKTFTRSEARAICLKYEGKLIAYYDQVYKVENCKRRRIDDSKTVYELQRAGQSIKEVSADAVIAMPEGKRFHMGHGGVPRSCIDLEGKYVTFSNVDVYFVEKCKKRMFPDWETYIRHRDKRGDEKGEILELSWAEHSALKKGEPIPSVIDELFEKVVADGVDVIPIDEACDGVEGKIVGYYSRLYKIERCRKREITPADLYIKRHRGRLKVAELSSEQWLSIPDGEPMVLKLEEPRVANGTKPLR